MILKKPYAFLIRHFKAIHFIIAVLLVVFAYESVGIVSFFNNYVINGYQTSIVTGLSKLYTPFFLYLLVIFIIFVVGTMLILMVHKQKPYNLYLFLFIYYLVVFLGLFFISSVLRGFETELLASTASRRIRDILVIMYLPQFIFIILMFIRAIGFDVKKFDFTSDIADLDLSAQDAEEFEVSVSFDGHRIKSKAHRIRREFGYYIKENKFVVVSLFVIAAIVAVFSIFHNMHSNFDYNYRMGAEFNYNKLTISFDDAIITNMDFKGNKISDYYYVVVKTHIKNNSGNTVSIDYGNIKLKVRDIYIEPSSNLNSNFVDFVPSSPSTSFAHKSDRVAALVYKINASQINASKQLVIYNGSVYDKGKYIDSHYIINLKADKYIDIDVAGRYNQNDSISFKETLLGNTSLTVKEYSIKGTNYRYKYQKCSSKDKCKDYDDLLVLPINTGYTNLLIVSVDFKEDMNTVYSKSYKKLSDFANYFCKIRYTINNEMYENSIGLTPENANDFMAFGIDSEINNAEKIDLVISIRNKEYIVDLKK